MRNTTKFICTGLVTGLSALAQSEAGSQKAGSPGDAARTAVIVGSADMARGVGMIGTPAFEYVRTEIGGPALVKGAPYSAEAVTERTQTLPDGNRIVHKEQTTLARDSDGRTRRDINPAMPGMNAADAPKFSFIYDPTTNTSYTLNHNNRTATKSAGRSFNIQVMNGPEGQARAMALSHADAAQHNATYQVVNTADSGKAVMISQNGVMTAEIPPGVPAGVPAARVRVAGPDATDQNVRTEDLGKQNIEGIMAEGTRTTTTIPAGQIGNERPIEIISERWYSPELQTVVMSKRTDPRLGENTYRLTGISRKEPDKSLFEIPSSYTVQDTPTIGPDRLILRKPATLPDNK